MPYIPGIATGRTQCRPGGDAGGRILVLRQTELGPDTMTTRPAGFVIVDGAPFSHSLIALLGTGIPTIILGADQAAPLAQNMQVVLDGTRGLVSTDAPAGVHAEEVQHAASSSTADGVDIILRVSARDLAAVQRAVADGGDAIGLVRSEFLIPPEGRIPDSAFYQRELRALCAAAAPLPVTIRLLDIAADKVPAWLPGLRREAGTLGLQGVRLFNHEPVQSVYRAQLDAINALSGEFDLRVLIPYVAGVEELDHWAGLIRGQLKDTVPVGAMAETPAAALQIGEWSGIADFVGLGCNDLMQCLFGADRDRPDLRAYLDPYAPPLYRFLQQLAVTAPASVPHIQLCGVLPQLPGILPVLLGLGYRIFSVDATSLGHLRDTIVATSTRDARHLAIRVCAARSSRQVRELLA